MATDAGFIDYIIDQLAGLRGISSRRMFGEYALYLDGKVVALVCDNQLFVKPTAAGRKLIGTPVESPPYPGAKPAFLVDEQLEDTEFLRALLRAPAKELPEPKPKKGKANARRAKP